MNIVKVIQTKATPIRLVQQQAGPVRVVRAETPAVRLVHEGGIVNIGGAQVPTNPHRPRVRTIVSADVLVFDADSEDQLNVLALGVDALVSEPTGLPSDGQQFRLRVRDDGVVHKLTWDAAFRSSEAVLPSRTIMGKTLYVSALRNDHNESWDCVLVRAVAPPVSTLLTKLVAYYKFDEESGPALSATGGNAAIEVTATQGVSVAGGLAYGFSGSYVLLLGNPLNKQEFSIGAWIQTSASGDQTIYSSNDAHGVHFRINGDGRLGLLVRGVTMIGTSTSIVNDGIRRHVLVTYDLQGNWSFYVNGFLSASGSNPQVFSYTGNAYIGLVGGEPFIGTVSKVGLWERALSSSEASFFEDATLDYPF